MRASSRVTRRPSGRITGGAMVTRREAIAAAIAVPLAAGAQVPARLASGSPQERSVPLFVADARYLEARMAARAASVHPGTRTHVVMGDVTSLYGSLDSGLRSRPFAIAGLAPPHVLFVLERLAWERGLCTLYRGQHRLAAEGAAAHELAGARGIVEPSHTMPDEFWPLSLGA